MMERTKSRRGFTLVELLVVISIIAILIGLLLPTVTKARAKGNGVACQSNLRQVGIQMLIYADANNGFLFPDDMGWQTNTTGNWPTGPFKGEPYIYPPYPGGVPQPYQDPLQLEYQSRVWPYSVFGVWNPPIMLCPTDEQAFGQHSYIVNEHMAYYQVKYSSGLPQGVSASTIVLMGEKVSTSSDYYMEYGDFAAGKVEEHRHGIQWGSNYLFLDLHVDTTLYQTSPDPNSAQSQQTLAALDPWDFSPAAGAPGSASQ